MPESNAQPPDPFTGYPHPSRRQFLRSACAPVVLASLGISLTSCSDESVVGPEKADPIPTEESGIIIDGSQIMLDLTKPDAEALSQTGGFLLISQADTVAVNVGDSTIRAFTSICTHQQCTINSFQEDVFQCPCHGSEFDTSGEAVAGPADQPLAEYEVSRSGDTVTIMK